MVLNPSIRQNRKMEGRVFNFFKIAVWALFFPVSFQAPTAAAATGSPSRDLPPSKNPYSLQVTTQYINDPAHAVKCTLSLQGDNRILWSHNLDYPVKDSVIVKDSGRLFLQLDHPPSGEIRV